MKFVYPPGATPLEPEELENLIPHHISTQKQLNEWEQANILVGENWAKNKKAIISVEFIKKLHYHMFDQTWEWAGQFRCSEKNIGIAWYQIAEELKKLCADVESQLLHQSFSDDEIAVRMHHKLVFIHPFCNGNERHARLMADLLIMARGKDRFSWGAAYDLYAASEVRTKYIEALQCADRGDYEKLFAFARSEKNLF